MVLPFSQVERDSNSQRRQDEQEKGPVHVYLLLEHGAFSECGNDLVGVF